MPRPLRLVLLWTCALLVGAPSLARAQTPPVLDPVRADTAMVVSAHRLASEAGVEMLRQGGNAVDAAVATGFALAVVHPQAGNIGGGGFMVIRAADGTATTIDYREKAPMAATRDMFLDEEGNAVAERSRVGYLASGVPGSVAGLLKALEERGTLAREAVLAPAIRLAAEGFPLSRHLARSFNGRYTEFAAFPSTAKYFTKGDSTQTYEEGELFVQADLAETLRRVRDEGRDGFYAGETARLLAEQMAEGGGLITEEDLAAYEAVERAPVTGTYRGYRVYAMGPPSSGGVALAQLLNAVEPYDVRGLGYQSSALVHLMGEAMRRVYADRAQWLGDPDFEEVPTGPLAAKDYMQRRMQTFNPYRADTSATVDYGDPLASESMETTHYSVVDAAGNAVSVTTTINGSYGSGVVVDGAGFFLNNEMDDFSAKPGVPNMFGLIGSEANAVEAEKRMLSSMTPTIVEDPAGRLFMVIGTPGGATIITTVFQVMLNVIDHRMNIQQAVAAGRVHHQWKPDVLRYERYALPRDVVRNLQRRGWTMDGGGAWGAADGIVVRYDDEGASGDGAPAAGRRTLHGGADPRGDDTAVGY